MTALRFNLAVATLTAVAIAAFGYLDGDTGWMTLGMILALVCGGLFVILSKNHP